MGQWENVSHSNKFLRQWAMSFLSCHITGEGRLIHSPSLVTVWLQGIKHGITIGWHLCEVGVNIGWDCISHNGLWAFMTGGNFLHFSDVSDTLSTALTVGKCLPSGLCKETVKESISCHITGRGSKVFMAHRKKLDTDERHTKFIHFHCSNAKSVMFQDFCKKRGLD